MHKVPLPRHQSQQCVCCSLPRLRGPLPAPRPQGLCEVDVEMQPKRVTALERRFQDSPRCACHGALRAEVSLERPRGLGVVVVPRNRREEGLGLERAGGDVIRAGGGDGGHGLGVFVFVHPVVLRRPLILLGVPLQQSARVLALPRGGRGSLGGGRGKLRRPESGGARRAAVVAREHWVQVVDLPGHFVDDGAHRVRESPVAHGALGRVLDSCSEVPLGLMLVEPPCVEEALPEKLLGGVGRSTDREVERAHVPVRPDECLVAQAPRLEGRCGRLLEPGPSVVCHEQHGGREREGREPLREGRARGARGLALVRP
mmetsp:Transcript_40784/g.130153  ORF Transcript_40784/g.130153 Transcript_40784/m.130153 type:complete len:315 (-) Transcript_40784:322-1266(-)